MLYVLLSLLPSSFVPASFHSCPHLENTNFRLGFDGRPRRRHLPHRLHLLVPESREDRQLLPLEGPHDLCLHLRRHPPDRRQEEPQDEKVLPAPLQEQPLFKVLRRPVGDVEEEGEGEKQPDRRHQHHQDMRRCWQGRQPCNLTGARLWIRVLQGKELTQWSTKNGQTRNPSVKMLFFSLYIIMSFYTISSRHFVTMASLHYVIMSLCHYFIV